MNSRFTREQELATEQLRAIAPLVRLARATFIACAGISPATLGSREAVALENALLLAKAILLLEHNLNGVISAKRTTQSTGPGAK